MKTLLNISILLLCAGSIAAQNPYLKSFTFISPDGIDLNRDSLAAVGGVKKFMVYQYQKEAIASYLLWYDEAAGKSYCAWVEDTALGAIREIDTGVFNDPVLMKVWTKQTELSNLRFIPPISASFGKEVLVYYLDGKQYVLERGQNLDYKYDPKLNSERNRIMAIVRQEVLR